MKRLGEMRKIKGGRGGGGKALNATSKPQRKKSAAAKAKQTNTPLSPDLAEPSGLE